LICIFLCATCSLRATVPYEPFHRGDSLFAVGDFFEAALEFERVYFFSDDSRTRAIANLRRARVLKQSGNFVRARNDLQRSIGFRADKEIHFQILYETAFCDYMSGNYSSTVSILKQMEHHYGDSHSYYDVLLLFALSHIMLEQWDLALEKTMNIIETRVEEPVTKTILFSDAHRLFDLENVPAEKSENRAARLSTFLPGTGHWYAGKPVRGFVNATSQLSSLVLTGVMAYNSLYVSGFIIGLGMFQSFYFGGINQASRLARQSNLQSMGDYKQLLKDFVIEIEEGYAR
jgi:tetratricopeptide (TPR) repeat protein